MQQAFWFILIFTSSLLAEPVIVATVPYGTNGVQQNMEGRQTPPPTIVKEKNKTIIYHNLTYSIVSKANISGEKRKMEIVYNVGNAEHHILVRDQNEAKEFYKRPERYMQKLAEVEGLN